MKIAIVTFYYYFRLLYKIKVSIDYAAKDILIINTMIIDALFDIIANITVWLDRVMRAIFIFPHNTNNNYILKLLCNDKIMKLLLFTAKPSSNQKIK